MIFQLSERERVRVAPIVRVRYVPPRKVQSVVRPAPTSRREVKFQEPYKPAMPSAPNLDAPFEASDATVAEKQETKPFQDCDKFEAQGGCQTVLHQRYEGNRGDILRCNTCGRTFSARRGGISFRSRLSPEMLQQLIDCHRQGDSIRKTSKILSLNRGTVRRYFRLLEEGTTLEPE